MKIIYQTIKYNLTTIKFAIIIFLIIDTMDRHGQPTIVIPDYSSIEQDIQEVYRRTNIWRYVYKDLLLLLMMKTING